MTVSLRRIILRSRGGPQYKHRPTKLLSVMTHFNFHQLSSLSIIIPLTAYHISQQRFIIHRRSKPYIIEHTRTSSQHKSHQAELSTAYCKPYAMAPGPSKHFIQLTALSFLGLGLSRIMFPKHCKGCQCETLYELKAPGLDQQKVLSSSTQQHHNLGSRNG